MQSVKNGQVNIQGGQMDYICFGRGKQTLVMIPGVGDGFKTVKGMALPFSILYKKLAKQFTVYVFSRRNNIQDGMTTKEMADDLSDAMESLGLTNAVIVGVSQGGMIAQWLAIDHSDKVSKLILVVTMARPNKTVEDTLHSWIELAERGDYKGIMVDTAVKSYSEKKKRRALLTYKLLGNIGKPKDFSRFIVQAKSCLAHDSYEKLNEIKCPTLVIGGSDDRVLSGEASVELSKGIRDARLKMYRGLSHGLYEEAPDFLDQIISFCQQC